MAKNIFLICILFITYHINAQTKFINNESNRLFGDDNKEILKGNINLVIENKRDSSESTIDSIYFDKNGNIIRNVRFSNKNGVLKILSNYNNENLIETNYYLYNSKINMLDSLHYFDKNTAKYYLLFNGVYNDKTEKIEKYNNNGLLLEVETILNDIFYDKKIITYNTTNTIKSIQYYDGNTNKLTTEEYFYTKKLLDSFIVKENKILTKKYSYQYDKYNNIISHVSLEFYKGKIMKKILYTFKHQLDKNGNWIKREQIINGKTVAIRTRQLIYWN
jgi:hypothetical protein